MPISGLIVSVIIIGGAVAALLWWRRETLRKRADLYICDVCGDRDCDCHRAGKDSS